MEFCVNVHLYVPIAWCRSLYMEAKYIMYILCVTYNTKSDCCRILPKNNETRRISPH